MAAIGAGRRIGSEDAKGRELGPAARGERHEQRRHERVLPVSTEWLMPSVKTIQADIGGKVDLA